MELAAIILACAVAVYLLWIPLLAIVMIVGSIIACLCYGICLLLCKWFG
jgi:hypothetical protein